MCIIYKHISLIVLYLYAYIIYKDVKTIETTTHRTKHASTRQFDQYTVARPTIMQ